MGRTSALSSCTAGLQTLLCDGIRLRSETQNQNVRCSLSRIKFFMSDKQSSSHIGHIYIA